MFNYKTSNKSDRLEIIQFELVVNDNDNLMIDSAMTNLGKQKTIKINIRYLKVILFKNISQ